MHRYEKLPPSVGGASRNVRIGREVFRASAKHASMSFRGIVSGGPSPPWYSPSADRHGVASADLQVAADAFASGQFRDATVANAWVGAICDYRHQIAIRRTGSDGDRWFICLKHMPGSACVLWPCILRNFPGHGSQQYFIPEVQLTEPFLATICSFTEWEGASFAFRSAAWQHTDMPSARDAIVMPAIRLVRSSAVMPLASLAAKCAFWSLSKAWLQSAASLLGLQVPDGSSVVALVELLCKSILGVGDEEAVECVEHRLVCMSKDLGDADAEAAEVEELEDVLERRDEKLVEAEYQARQKDEQHFREVREEYRQRRAAVRPKAAAKPSAVNPRGVRYPRRLPAGEISHSQAKELSPPNSYVWRSLRDGRWCGRFPPYGEMSRSWARHTEQGALRQVLAHLWEQYLTSGGFTTAQCPIGGLF